MGARDPILPDILVPDLKVVFCGSAAGRVSARRGAYYAGPGNRFWPTLHAVALTPRLLAPLEFREVLGFGIGLTDLAKHAFGADSDLPSAADDVDALRGKIERYRPRILAFNGVRPARRFLGGTPGYGRQEPHVGGVAVFVLPSTSGLARRFWDERPWRDLADQISRTS